MPYINKTTAQEKDNVSLYYEDHGSGKPVILIHGWPLSSSMWEYQVPVLIDAGYRVITYDRRGFGRSSQPYSGYNYHTMAEDLKDIIQKLDLKNVSLVGFSMGGGELAQYIDTHGNDRISKLVFMSSIAPFMLQTDDNEDGVPDEVFQDMEKNVKTDRAGFLKGFGRGFVNYDDNQDRVSEGQLDYNFQIAVQASAKGTLDCIHAFGRTDLREACKKIKVPTLFMHGDADEIVPLEKSSKKGHELVEDSKLEVINGAPHGMYVTHTDEVNKVLLDFLK